MNNNNNNNNNNSDDDDDDDDDGDDDDDDENDDDRQNMQNDDHNHHCFVFRLFYLQLALRIGNSMICSDIWNKFHEWYFKIVIRNFTSR